MYALGMLLSLIALLVGIIGYLTTGSLLLLVLVGVGTVGVSVPFVVSRGGPRRP